MDKEWIEKWLARVSMADTVLRRASRKNIVGTVWQQPGKQNEPGIVWY